MTEGANTSAVLVVNELGWGNGVLELPFALALARRFDRVVHSPSPFLDALGPEALGAAWISYNADWAFDLTQLGVALRELVERNGVSHVVNFRNEDVGSAWSTAFTALWADLSAVKVWNLLDQYTGSDPYIPHRWTSMFRAHGLKPEWDVAKRLIQSSQPAASEERVLVVCSGASREDKALRPEVWAGAIAAVYAQHPDLHVRLVHGRSEQERTLGLKLEDLLRARGLEPFSACPENIEELATELGRAAVVAANDSFPMHLANALGRPTLGLFSVTERTIWGPPDGTSFRGRASNACLECVGVMPTQGTCWEQAACPSPPNASWDPGQIAADLMSLLGAT
jgi:hypothetical protein